MPRSRKASHDHARALDGDPALSAYFETIARHDVLTAEEEIGMAQAVERAEIDYWRALLSHAPALPTVAAVLDAHEDTATDSRATLEELARAARRRPLGKRRKARWDAAVDDLSQTLRRVDVDRELARRADDAVHRMVGLSTQHTSQDALLDPPQAAVRLTAPFRRYLARVAQAREAQQQEKERFVLANLRLVVSIARRYAHGRMPLIDLIQEGNVGLMKAVERFDHTRGFRFSTYASWWIRHAVGRARADKERTVRIPVHMLEASRRVARAGQNLAQRTGHRPSVAELAEETGLPEHKVDSVRTRYTSETLSLDRAVNDEDGRSFVDFLVDEQARSPHEVAEQDAWRERVPHLLDSLSPLEARILRWRFGLHGERELTLKSIGDHYNLSRERIRQIQQEALAKLRRRVVESGGSGLSSMS